MNRNKNGIIVAQRGSNRRAIDLAASSDAGKFACEVVPKYIFELVKHHEDGVEETILTPFAKQMRERENEGYTYVTTHETQQLKYEKLTE